MMIRALDEVWRMIRSDSRLETFVAVGTVAAWLALTYRKHGGGDRRTTL